MSDSETKRAEIAAVIWSGITTAERTRLKTPAALLPIADDLLKRSISLGSPYASDSVDVVLVDASAFAAVRWREWLGRQSTEVQALYVTPVPLQP